MNKIDLKDKVAIVTGGVQGFGLAVVERFLNSDANVVIWENDKKLLDKFQTISDVHKIQTDVSNAESVEAAVNETINKCGRIDICLLYTSDAADEGLGVDLGGRRIIK